MAKDVYGQPWRLDATGQGEGMANSGSWLRLNTFTAAATDICTMTGHGLQTGTPVRVEEGNSDLPLNLAEDTNYWVGRIDADTFYLYTTHAAAIAGGTAVDIGDAGTTPNYILMQPVFDHKIYVKTIVITGDGTNEGTVEITESSGGRTLARAEISDKDTGQDVSITHVNSYVEGVYVTTLDATNAVVLVYHGRP
jgi:hypothetical protein